MARALKMFALLQSSELGSSRALSVLTWVLVGSKLSASCSGVGRA